MSTRSTIISDKENMLDQVEEFFIENYLSSYSVLDKELNDEEKLLQWANEITEYILKYPGIQLLMRFIQIWQERKNERVFGT
jgi:hypothetical protein